MRLALSVAILNTTLGCSAAEPSDHRIVGVILVGNGAASVIQAPDTVRVHESFGVVINTFGSSSCTTPDGVDLRLAPTDVVITPYDRVPTDPAVSCTRDMAPRPHPVQARFSEPGLGRIIVQGRVTSDIEPGQGPVSVTKTVVVR
jgi:hypothetical protein